MEKSHAIVESPRVPRRGPYSQAVGLERVVKTTCYLAVPEAFDRLNALYAEYFPVTPPARSTPVVQLPRGLWFSIEAIAAACPGR
jgi:2-iminobutanoate/2-iminopropanoate deaminase